MTHQTNDLVKENANLKFEVAALHEHMEQVREEAIEEYQVSQPYFNEMGVYYGNEFEDFHKQAILMFLDLDFSQIQIKLTTPTTTAVKPILDDVETNKKCLITRQFRGLVPISSTIGYDSPIIVPLNTRRFRGLVLVLGTKGYDSVLKKANIVKYGLVELASEVGMDIKEPFGERPDWSARVFSPVQIKVCSAQCLCYLLYWEQVGGNASKSVDLTAFYDP
nr:hypothetical protein CFP56_76015 [Quercus suber]